MDKETLSNYGWIVVVTLVLSVMLALATPFGTYVGDGVVAIANSFVGTSNNAIDEDNIANLQNKWDNKLQGIDPALNPDDGTEPQDGDTYTYGDYEYRYNCYYYLSLWKENIEQDGWGVRVLDNTKTEYGAILESINGKPVKDMAGTFAYCVNLTTAPTIPNSVTDMQFTFYACKSLKTYVGSTDADGDFSNYVIPNGVANMADTFLRCALLETAPIIPNSVKNMYRTFYGCISLTSAPDIPNSLENIGLTFFRCTSLADASNLVIPSSIEDVSETFYGCTSLTGNIEINANIETTSRPYYSNCFYGTTQPIILTGTSPALKKIAATANNGNVTVAE